MPKKRKYVRRTDAEKRKIVRQYLNAKVKKSILWKYKIGPSHIFNWIEAGY